MTQNDSTPSSENTTGTSAENQTLTAAQQPSQRMLVLTFLGLIAGPLLALICAIMGFILILNSHTIAGVIFILVPTQAFLFMGIWAYGARKREAEKAGASSTVKPDEQTQ